MGPSITPIHRPAAPATTTAMARPVCAPEPRKIVRTPNLRDFLEMGLRESYPWRAVAVLAYGALEVTHTEHPADLGPKRR
jgi:hypothetical protein